MSALTLVRLEDTHEFLQTPDTCTIQIYHQPRPERIIWHHIVPQVCGGKTVKLNLVALCDNCHYAIHKYMYTLAMGGYLIGRSGLAYRQRMLYVVQGIAGAKAAGTLSKMPKEAA